MEGRAELDQRTKVIALLVLIAAVHLPLLSYGLIYDDGWTLRSNGFLRPEHFDLWLLVSPEAAARHIPDAFRPTLVVFDALSYRLLGLHAWAHHALSLILHVGICALVARWLRRSGAPDDVVLATVACFGLLGIHAEVVSVVSFREDLLAAALGLGAMICAIRVITATSTGRLVAWGGAAAGLQALACGAKLSAAPLPAVLLLFLLLSPWSAGREARRCPRRLILAIAVLAIGVGLALAQTEIVFGGSPYGVGNLRVLAQRIGLSPVLAASTRVHLGYLQQIVLPFNLSPEYVDLGASWLAPTVIMSSVALLGLLVLAFPTRRRPWVLSFAVLGWALLAIPTSNLVGLPNMRADRFMYLPSLPLCVGFALGALSLGERLRIWGISVMDGVEVEVWKWAPLALFVLLQGSFGLAASRVYVSNTTLWHSAIRKAPDSARAHALLGLERLAEADRGDALGEQVIARAERSCQTARDLDPDYELPVLCLGAVALVREDWGAAYELHALAVELSPDRNDRPIATLAQVSLDLPSSWLRAHPELGSDRAVIAQTWLERGLGAYPYSPELQTAAGHVFHRLGLPLQALEHYRRARSLRPDRWQTIAKGVELALDLGDAAAAHRTWWANQKLLARADPGTRTRLARRLADARTQPGFSLLHSLLSPGVFP